MLPRKMSFNVFLCLLIALGLVFSAVAAGHIVPKDEKPGYFNALIKFPFCLVMYKLHACIYRYTDQDNFMFMCAVDDCSGVLGRRGSCHSYAGERRVIVRDESVLPQTRESENIHVLIFFS